MKRSTVVIVTILVIVFVSGLLRLNDLSLYTDSTRYLLWASSLSQGAGWIDATQPVPESYVVNAPLYPLLIAPALWFPGSIMTSAKIATLLFGLTALFFFARWLRSSFQDNETLILTILLSAMPMTLVLFTEVLSESAYLLLVFASLYLLERQREGTERLLLIALLAVLPLVREVGIALVAAVVIVHVSQRNHRLALTIAGATAAVFLLWTIRNLFLVGTPETSQAANVSFIFQRALTTPDEPIVTEFTRRLSANLDSYRFELGGMILFPIPFPLINAPSSVFLTIFSVLQTVKTFLFILFVPAVIYGAWRDWSVGPNGQMRILFIVFSLIIVILYPVQDVRFLYPFLPFFLYFGFLAIRNIPRIPAKGTRAVSIAAICVVLIPNIITTGELIRSNLRYRAWIGHMDDGTSAPGRFYATPWSAVGRWIRDHTPQQTVIASSAKELAPFIGDRKLLEINKAVPRPQFEDMLRDHDVTVLVVPKIQNQLYAYAFNIMESGRLAATFETKAGDIRILTIPSLLTSINDDSPVNESDALLLKDTTLLAARKALLAGALEEADSLLLSILSYDPAHAEAAFQRVAALALTGNQQDALSAQRYLFQTPRSTSYIPVSRRLIELSGHLSTGRSAADPRQKAAALFVAGRIAWDLGLARNGRDLLDEALLADPSAYEPRIWSAFFALHSNDLESSMHHLRILKETYPEEPIVSDLQTIDTLLRDLYRIEEPIRRSEMWLRISMSLNRLELFSDALDAALTSYLLNPAGAEADEAVRSLLERMGKTFALNRWDMHHTR